VLGFIFQEFLSGYFFFVVAVKLPTVGKQTLLSSNPPVVHLVVSFLGEIPMSIDKIEAFMLASSKKFDFLNKSLLELKTSMEQAKQAIADFNKIVSTASGMADDEEEVEEVAPPKRGRGRPAATEVKAPAKAPAASGRRSSRVVEEEEEEEIEEEEIEDEDDEDLEVEEEDEEYEDEYEEEVEEEIEDLDEDEFEEEEIEEVRPRTKTPAAKVPAKPAAKAPEKQPAKPAPKAPAKPDKTRGRGR
jgi:hypothetical protein